MGLNTTSAALILGGLGSIFWGLVGWKKGWNILPLAGGSISLGLGLLDATDIVKLHEIGNKLKGSSGYGAAGVGAYQVDIRNLQYDPNNFYFAPRDRSILA